MKLSVLLVTVAVCLTVASQAQASKKHRVKRVQISFDTAEISEAQKLERESQSETLKLAQARHSAPSYDFDSAEGDVGMAD